MATCQTPGAALAEITREPDGQMWPSGSRVILVGTATSPDGQSFLTFWIDKTLSMSALRITGDPIGPPFRHT
jgi:hypothetical protein